jgi:hypothetical protein
MPRSVVTPGQVCKEGKFAEKIARLAALAVTTYHSCHPRPPMAKKLVTDAYLLAGLRHTIDCAFSYNEPRALLIPCRDGLLWEAG